MLERDCRPVCLPGALAQSERGVLLQDDTVQCPKCQFTGMDFYTKQLRSADEGQTIFYECPNCPYAPLSLAWASPCHTYLPYLTALTTQPLLLVPATHAQREHRSGAVTGLSTAVVAHDAGRVTASFSEEVTSQVALGAARAVTIPVTGCGPSSVLGTVAIHRQVTSQTRTAALW